MGYEIWDRDARALVADFDGQREAVDFLREAIRPLTVEEATRRLEPLELVKVTNEGRTTDVVSSGVDLLNLIFAPAPGR